VDDEGARRPNLLALDALRGVLATYVLCGHARWLLWAGYREWMSRPHAGWAVRLAQAAAGLRFGHEAVMVFFVLSGFFIHLRVARRLARGPDQRFDSASYFRRRAHRLVAPYLLALVVTVLCDLIGRGLAPDLYAAHTGDATLDVNFARKGYSWDAVLPALMLLPTSLGKDFGSNGPLWSLSFEVIYYLLYPLWLACRRRSVLVAYGLVPALAFAAGFVPGDHYPAVVASHYPIWLAGAALAEAAVRGWLSRRVAALALAAGLVTFGVYLVWPGTSFVKSVLSAVGYGAAAAAAMSGMPARWNHSLWMRPLRFLGLRSYTIYIVHFPVLVLLSAITFAVAGVRPQSGLPAMAGGLLALAVSVACFELVEKHFVHERIHLDAPIVRP
jgi:peptidoglycan/LPS O-acetylase OafA/YrhL